MSRILKGLPGEPSLQGAGAPIVTTDSEATGYYMGGLVAVNSTAGATIADTVDTAIGTVSVPAGLMKNTGDSVRIKAWGGTGATANNKTVKIRFGTDVVCTTGILAANNKDWSLEATVVRTGAATQIATSVGQANGAIVLSSNTTATQTLSAAVAITLMGLNGTSAANDVTFKGMTVEFLPAA